MECIARNYAVSAIFQTSHPCRVKCHESQSQYHVSKIYIFKDHNPETGGLASW